MFLDAVERLNQSYGSEIIKIEHGAVGVVTFKDISMAKDQDIRGKIYGFRLKKMNPKVKDFVVKNNVTVVNHNMFQELLDELTQDVEDLFIERNEPLPGVHDTSEQEEGSENEQI